MKVKQLEILQRENPNDLVVMATDSEGNSFRRMSEDYSRGHFNPNTQEFYTGDIEVLEEPWVPAICVWPGQMILKLPIQDSTMTLCVMKMKHASCLELFLIGILFLITVCVVIKALDIMDGL